eukprot:TRINITY_DN3563_c0_g1_i8.p1 TRINITY_DN3563_c0_g1~~TRINITY_DN3563_c0_g1_i8.p1  ORF type:complete len:206 (-),score=40.78 TRINITY_DN3563_c0_g1_i8:224-790(-)
MKAIIGKQLKANLGSSLNFNSSNPLTVTLIQHLNTSGLSSLSQNYQIRIRKSYSFPELYHLRYTPKSPLEYQISRECRNMIVKQGEDLQWHIIAFAYPKFFYYFPQQYMEKIQANSKDQSRLYSLNISEAVNIRPLLEGNEATLYCYQGKWLLCTQHSVDGSEKFGSTGSFSSYFWKVYSLYYSITKL